MYTGIPHSSSSLSVLYVIRVLTIKTITNGKFVMHISGHVRNMNIYI